MASKNFIRRLEKKADRALSIRTRKYWARKNGGKCALCNVKPVQCCFHFVSRRRKATRWQPINVIGACHTCNWEERYFPDKSRAWFIKHYGPSFYLFLVEMAEGSFDPSQEFLEGVINGK